MTDDTQPPDGTERTDMDPESHYDEFSDKEWDRLRSNPVTRLEYENTIDVLSEELPPEGEVLDAGGGPGRYSLWLADRGHRVQHLDISAEQVKIAKRKAKDRGLDDQINCRKGDIRDLPFKTERFEAVCCLGGPLSHVPDPEQRRNAAEELARVAGPDAPVFVSVIGRLTAIRDGIKHGLEDHPELIPEIARTGDYTQELVAEYDAEGWAECHFFRADELEAELTRAGLTVERLVGLEGPASVMEPELKDASPDAIDAVREVVRMLRDDRTVADLSAHILAICRA